MDHFNTDSHPATLVELLRYRAMAVNTTAAVKLTAQQPGDLAYIFLLDGEVEEVSITFSELDRQARAIAAWLENQTAKGERALLLYPPGLDFIAAFFGCLYAGVIAVPAYPPRLNRPIPRIQAIVAGAQARFALTTTEILENVEQRFEHTPDLKALAWLDTLRLPDGSEDSWQDLQVTPDTLAFLQYTSGSTSTPKGVMLSHGNLLANLEMIRQGFHLEPGLKGVIWLPSYHDMGLIGGILSPMYVSGMSVLMSPLFFLQRPVRWLEAVTRYKGNVTGAPNFAFDLCVDKISAEQRQNLDLSSINLAFCGAEPIRAETLKRFARTFAECGFRPDTFFPCYGLAEATLFVSGGDGPARPKEYAFLKAALERDQVIEASPGEEDAQTFVGCGKSWLDEEIVIAHPEQMTRCAPGEVGEIWLSSSAVAKGYWNQPDETERIFHAYLANTGEGPFLRTGDLGFFHDNQLFIAGRLKDLIIIRGTNHYPQDIELTIADSHPSLQPDAGAAFSVLVDGEEQLVVVQEMSREGRRSDPNEVGRAIRRAIAENHDLQVHTVVLIKPLSIPKTSSGKIQRHACKAAFLEGSLEVIWNSSLFNGSSPQPT